MSPTPYGSWPSPIAAPDIARSGVTLGGPRMARGAVMWHEVRPAEGGRGVVVCRTASGDYLDINPSPYNVRTQVHEYGGGAWFFFLGVLYFTNWTDQRLYRCEMGAEPVAITPEPPFDRALRYADMRVMPDGSRLVCVRERHARDEEATNEIVVIPTDGSSDATVLVGGADFYSSPRLSSDGTRIAWIEWNHPNLPWDGTELYVASFDGGTVSDVKKVAGAVDESVVQPSWGPGDILHYISDRSGWWNIYTQDGTAVCAEEAEFAGPHWVFGLSNYDFTESGDIVCSFARNGSWRLGLISGGKLSELGPTTSPAGQSIRYSEGKVAFIAASPTRSPEIAIFDLETKQTEVVRSSSTLEMNTEDVSIAESISFESAGRTAHAFYYAPQNSSAQPLPDEKPPLLVLVHGGPTSQVTDSVDPRIQYFTTRGFAVVDVNYGGSTGYGREYRCLLNGNWGVVDVEDSVSAARYLTERGDVDPERIAIRGGSAGGFTTLMALVSSDVFKAGANYFGVTEHESFVDDTHKFESRYLDSLIGPYPERKDLYFERSPANFIDRIKAPVITFQGTEDEIVPPSQSEAVVEALRRNGIPCAYVTYEGEQHGFRKAENIAHSMETELYFYGRVFGFEPADDLEPIEIENLSPG